MSMQHHNKGRYWVVVCQLAVNPVTQLLIDPTIDIQNVNITIYGRRNVITVLHATTSPAVRGAVTRTAAAGVHNLKIKLALA